MTSIQPLYRVFATSLAMLAIAACGGGSGGSPAPQPAPDPDPDPDVSQPPPALTVQPVYPGVSFSQVVLLLQAPGDASQWYVVEKPGTISRFDNDESVSSSSLMLDIRARVDDGAGEAGLLGFAFHPDYPATPEVFVSYTEDGGSSATPFISNIARFTTLDGGLSFDPASEEILLQVLQDGPNHNGGNLAFGPDGLLYAGFGDGGGGGDPNDNAQNTTNLLGTIVRIDVDSGSPYTVPGDNPFAANANCVQGFGAADCPEIYAYGLRNPWRFSFDSQLGDLWLGDVGQNSWEEVNRVTLGGDYGWDDREGAHCFEPATGCIEDSIDPVTEYDHSLGQSVTGGYVYRGTTIASAAGWYVFGDFISGTLFGVPADSAPGTSPDILGDTSLAIATFAEDVDGELYLVSYPDGSIYRLVSGT